MSRSSVHSLKRHREHQPHPNEVQHNHNVEACTSVFLRTLQAICDTIPRIEKHALRLLEYGHTTAGRAKSEPCWLALFGGDQVRTFLIESMGLTDRTIPISSSVAELYPQLRRSSAERRIVEFRQLLDQALQAPQPHENLLIMPMLQKTAQQSRECLLSWARLSLKLDPPIGQLGDLLTLWANAMRVLQTKAARSVREDAELLNKNMGDFLSRYGKQQDKEQQQVPAQGDS